jgi:branched-chain amino acid aminotransferase
VLKIYFKLSYIFIDGKFLIATSPSLLITNKSFRYGDGFFETIRVVNNKIPLWALHSNRILNSLQILQGNLPKNIEVVNLEKSINQTVVKNKLTDARVRLSFYRDQGGLTDFTHNIFSFIIEAFALQEGNYEVNQNGLELGFYETHKKISGTLSNVKSSSFQIYSLAAQYAKQQKLNDVIVLNEKNEIVDTTIANIFIIKNGVGYTPYEASGAVLGCMRKYILENYKTIEIKEQPLLKEDILEADEVFLTNAILGLRWVKSIGDKMYLPKVSFDVYNTLIAPLYQTNSHT